MLAQSLHLIDVWKRGFCFDAEEKVPSFFLFSLKCRTIIGGDELVGVGVDDGVNIRECGRMKPRKVGGTMRLTKNRPQQGVGAES